MMGAHGKLSFLHSVSFGKKIELEKVGEGAQQNLCSAHTFGIIFLIFSNIKIPLILFFYLFFYFHELIFSFVYISVIIYVSQYIFFITKVCIFLHIYNHL